MELTGHEGLRLLPAVHKVLAWPDMERIVTGIPAPLATSTVSAALDELRRLWQSGVDSDTWSRAVESHAIVRRVERKLRQALSVSLRPVLNLTGTVIHTNLGRAPLSRRAIESVTAVAKGYSNLEYNVQTGERGSRHYHLEQRLCDLTGAEAALVVNNNAAAVFLVLRELAAGGEAIVSRGQLVEIGGSFRIPDIMAQSGVRLVEVGTTNKTRLADYERAVTEETKLMVRVHTSNFRIVGFTEQPDLESLVAAAHDRGVMVYEDLGSGALFDFAHAGIGDEPTVRYSVKSGVDVVTFSGDKLLGGAQAGIILGRKAVIEQMKKNQLLRALRVDKLTLAALDATLVAYQSGELAELEIPVVRMLTESYASISQRAEQLLLQLQQVADLVPYFTLDAADDVSRVGGGALPEETLPTRVLRLTPTGMTAQKLFDDLRLVPTTPVIGRVQKHAVLLDVRTLLPGEDADLCAALRQLAQSYGHM